MEYFDTHFLRLMKKKLMIEAEDLGYHGNKVKKNFSLVRFRILNKL